MPFSVKILGSNSATPAYGRNHTAQFIQIQKHTFLLDCGEGTQLQLAKYHCKAQKINHIFISHLHGDHYLGLMGLIFTMHLLRREKDLNIYGPQGLDEIITLQLKYSASALNYKIRFHQTDSTKTELLFADDTIEISSFPLNHRIPCTGFLFKEKPKPIRLHKERLPADLTLLQIATLKKGGDILNENGEVIFKNSDLTLPPRKSRSYAYCSDTKYDETILPYIKDVDLLYHEATFLEAKAIWAEKTFHSTTKEAATIAKKANAGLLAIGHYSARYKDVTPFLEEAKQHFDNTILAIEGESIEIED
ncbi:ribonuclease Z [Fulvivirga sp. RKSG066]|uniref:ribonuclease Z n=1 Tax=Fulvivirga aurantia TaxID=2529383 RepID=UPI0012BBC3C0|nr:ribonuclease Z [Fulvivirga aurantia]MTI20653.1 ribonuclease Z [Fulvivirga aurantia]